MRLTVGIGLESLGDAEREAYETLAVFPEDTDIPLSVLERYWPPALDIESVCEDLHDRSLLRDYDWEAGTVRLNPAQQLQPVFGSRAHQSPRMPSWGRIISRPVAAWEASRSGGRLR